MTTITLEEKEYQLDIEKAKELGLLKEKNSRVKSWEEFKEKYLKSTGYSYSDLWDELINSPYPVLPGEQLTPHEAKAIAAFSKLLKLRRDWIGEWEPDWSGTTIKTKCYVIECLENKIRICPQWIYSRSLSFPTEQMATEFLETFRDLIEEAKTLI